MNRSWIVDVRRLQLSESRDVRVAADANMFVLNLATPIEMPEVRDALEILLCEYRQKVDLSEKSGLFYAWVDAVSGTVRCSFCEAMHFEELPFRCRLKRANSLEEVAVLATEAYADVIPSQELVEVGWTAPDGDASFELSVFATMIGDA